MKNNRLDTVTAFFLITTIATSVTGFCFLPYNGFTPAQVFGIISMVLLGLAIYGRYARHLAGPWRKVYIITAIAALYLNFFVGIVQSFQKIPILKAVPPAANSPLFAPAQGIAFLLFVAAGYFAVKRFQRGSV